MSRKPRAAPTENHVEASSATVIDQAAMLQVIDTHVHLNAMYSGGLNNEWVADAVRQNGMGCIRWCVQRDTF